MAKIYRFRKRGESCHNCSYYRTAVVEDLGKKRVIRCCARSLAGDGSAIGRVSAASPGMGENRSDGWCSGYRRLKTGNVADLHKILSQAACRGCRDFIDKERLKHPLIKIDEAFVLGTIRFLNRSRLCRKQDKRTLNKYVIGTGTFTHPALIRFNPLFCFAESLPDTLLDARVIFWGKNCFPADASDETYSRFLKGLLIFLDWYQTDRPYPQEPLEFDAYVDAPDVSLGPDQRATVLAQNAVNSVSLNAGDFERYVVRCSIAELNQGKVIQPADRLNYLLSVQGFFQPFIEERINPKVLMIRSIVSAVQADGRAALQYLYYLPEEMKNAPQVAQYAKLCERMG